jgi:hypothetical protein
MLVKDLIEALEGMDPEAEVHFSYNYGDHWRTEVAPEVEQVKRGYVGYSDYHCMDKLLDEEDLYPDEEDGNPEENARSVVVLS